MPKISQRILPQGYEVIRDMIGEIIADELPEQLAFSYGDEISEAALVADVYVERFLPVQDSELSEKNIIIVNLVGGQFDNFKPLNHDGNCQFNIDFYCSATSTDDYSGDVMATFELQRLMGVVKSILMHPIYETLNFARPFIMGRYVDDMKIQDPKQKEEATNFIMGRINLSVRCIETLNPVDLTELRMNTTSVKLHETERGFMYIYDSEA